MLDKFKHYEKLRFIECEQKLFKLKLWLRDEKTADHYQRIEAIYRVYLLKKRLKRICRYGAKSPETTYMVALKLVEKLEQYAKKLRGVDCMTKLNEVDQVVFQSLDETLAKLRQVKEVFKSGK